MKIQQSRAHDQANLGILRILQSSSLARYWMLKPMLKILIGAIIITTKFLTKFCSNINYERNIFIPHQTIPRVRKCTINTEWTQKLKSKISISRTIEFNEARPINKSSTQAHFIISIQSIHGLNITPKILTNWTFHQPIVVLHLLNITHERGIVMKITLERRVSLDSLSFLRGRLSWFCADFLGDCEKLACAFPLNEPFAQNRIGEMNKIGKSLQKNV